MDQNTKTALHAVIDCLSHQEIKDLITELVELGDEQEVVSVYRGVLYHPHSGKPLTPAMQRIRTVQWLREVGEDEE